MPRSPTSPFPWQRLLVLTALVVWAHAALLSNPPSAWTVVPQVASSMTTRTIAPAPATVSAPPSVSLPSPPAMAKPPRPMPKRATAPRPSLMPNTPATQSNIAQAAPEIVANSVPAVTDTVATAAAPEQEPVVLAAQPSATPSALPSRADTAGATPVSLATATAASLATSTDSGKKPAPEVALKFPASGKFSYNLSVLEKGQPVNGAGTLEWTSDGSQYQLRIEASALFVSLLSQSSVGALAFDGLRPERFSDKRFRRSEKATHFSRDGQPGAGGGRITFSGNQRQAALHPGAQDRLSVLVQLAALAAGDPAVFASAGPAAIPVASTEEVEIWQFVVDGSESIKLPAGETQAMHVVRHPGKEFDSRLELWLAPTLGYMPVRILRTEANGNTFDLQLRSPSLPRP